MILFIVEGRKREPLLLKAINSLFLKNKDDVIVSFDNNIYELYRQMDEDIDIVGIMKKKLIKENKLGKDFVVSDIAEKYLFFDYDFHNKNISLEEMNRELSEMLVFFNEETENGKLYINYPMVESIYYTKQLLDKDYYRYVVERNECKDFKRIASNFSFYKNLDFITLPNHIPTESEIDKIRTSWQLLMEQNARKANFICSDNNTLPIKKETINQSNIFDNQVQKYVSKDEVSVLNSIPLFLYDYLG